MASMVAAYMNGDRVGGGLSGPEGDSSPMKENTPKFNFTPIAGSSAKRSSSSTGSTLGERSEGCLSPPSLAANLPVESSGEELKVNEVPVSVAVKVNLGRPSEEAPRAAWTDAHDDDEELQKSCFVLLFGATPNSANGASLVCSNDTLEGSEAESYTSFNSLDRKDSPSQHVRRFVCADMLDPPNHLICDRTSTYEETNDNADDEPIPLTE